MESTKEMLLPRPTIDGSQQPLDESSVTIVSVDQDQETNKLYTDAQDDVSKTVVHTTLYASDPNLTMAPDNSARARLRRLLSTHRFQVFVVSFVIVDCMVVIAELLMDLRILGLMEDAGLRNKNSNNKLPVEAHYLVPDVLHSISIAILAMFLLETVIKVAAFGLTFLRMGWEIFDAVVILVTFVLDVLMQHSHSSTNGLGLFIILRLWRVARILNGMVRSVKSQAVRHVECEKRRREALEDELLKYRELCHRQKGIIMELENLLKNHDIPLPANVATSLVV